MAGSEAAPDTAPGTISASVRNAGRLAPGNSGAGRITITGNYTQLASGVRSIELGGPAPDTQYDRLVVNGNATIDGTLEVTLINSFLPSAGTAVQPLTFASRSGTFATITGLSLGGGLFLAPTYGTTGFTLTTN